MREAFEDSEEGVSIGGVKMKDIRFADDQVVIAETEEGLQKLVDSLHTTIGRYNMKMNIKKTKVMRISRKGEGNMDIYINGNKIDQVKSFKYLGTEIT